MYMESLHSSHVGYVLGAVQLKSVLQKLYQ